jgi:hypothetical protein
MLKLENNQRCKIWYWTIDDVSAHQCRYCSKQTVKIK